VIALLGEHRGRGVEHLGHAQRGGWAWVAWTRAWPWARADYSRGPRRSPSRRMPGGWCTSDGDEVQCVGRRQMPTILGLPTSDCRRALASLDRRCRAWGAERASRAGRIDHDAADLTDASPTY
jgi:hypothetical protein